MIAAQRLVDRKSLLSAAVDRLRPELEELSLRIHAHPELALEEHQAAAWLSDRLQAAGFAVERGAAGLETAFLGRYTGGAGPTVALLAEYDALPGVGHGCGHNIIGPSAIGAALALKAVWPDLPGTILVVGSPAEESRGGKACLVEAGVFEGVAAALMLHPSVATQPVRPLIALQELTVAYHGRAAHAAVKPQDGVNALDALVLGYVGVAALRQHIRADARVHGVITHGGGAPNVVPDYAAGRFFVRAADDAYLEQLQQRVLACFQAGAEATGARLEVSFPSRRYSAMRANPTLAQLFRRNLAPLGLAETPFDPSLGAGSSDMGNVSAVVPALHGYIAIAPAGVPGHSEEFGRYACSPAGMQGLSNAAKLLAMMVADALAEPEHLQRAAEELARGAVEAPRAA